MERALIGLLLSLFTFAGAGCEQAGLFGGGLAASETFHAWQANLEAKKAELDQQYADVLAELENAPDPNAIATAKAKLDVIQQQQLINAGARLAIQSALEIPQAQGEDRTDAVAAAIVGAVGIGYQWLTKRKLNLKYEAHKAGQATFTANDPAAGSALYAAIGAERARAKV